MGVSSDTFVNHIYCFTKPNSICVRDGTVETFALCHGKSRQVRRKRILIAQWP